jgi:hypothetical protein
MLKRGTLRVNRGRSRFVKNDWELQLLPIICYKKATQVFDTIGVAKDLSGFQPLAAGGSVTLKRKKPL